VLGQVQRLAVIACGIAPTKGAAISRIRVLICRMHDADANQMTELFAFDLPEAHITALKPETAQDELETTTQETGNAILRHMLEALWEMIDARLAEQYRQRFSP
jgi:hypothetical protein